MSSTNDLVLRLNNLVGYAWSDVNSDTEAPSAVPGAYYYCHDAYGPRILQHVRNRNGSDVVMGELLSYLGDSASTLATTVANITSGSTTSAVTSSLTAGNHDGMICYVADNADAAGTAPEGESAIVASNTATLITLDKAYPLSVALAANDDLELISTWQVNDAADGDLNYVCAGIVLGRNGITDGYYGWIQKEGKTNALFANAITADEMVVADAAMIGDWGGTPDGQELWVGISLIGADDVTLDQVPIDVRLVSHNGVGTAP